MIPSNVKDLLAFQVAFFVVATLGAGGVYMLAGNQPCGFFMSIVLLAVLSFIAFMITLNTYWHPPKE